MTIGCKGLVKKIENKTHKFLSWLKNFKQLIIRFDDYKFYNICWFQV
jgi:hypothetical protein